MTEYSARKNLKFWRSVAVMYYMLILFLLLSPPEYYPDTEIPFMDKLVHAGMFGILGMLLQYITAYPHRALKVGILLAGISEFLQVFTPSRAVDPFDFAADVCGIVLGVVFMQKLPDLIQRGKRTQ